MSRSLKRFFSCKIILSSSVPSNREGLDVVQLCAVMMGRPVSSVMFSCEAGLSSLCTLGSNFMYGSCNLSCRIGSSRLLWLELIVEKRCLSLRSKVLELVTVCVKSKLSIRL